MSSVTDSARPVNGFYTSLIISAGFTAVSLSVAAVAASLFIPQVAALAGATLSGYAVYLLAGASYGACLGLSATILTAIATVYYFTLEEPGVPYK